MSTPQPPARLPGLAAVQLPPLTKNRLSAVNDEPDLTVAQQVAQWHAINDRRALALQAQRQREHWL